MKIPTEFERLFDHDWRECACYGGRYSLKSHTVARYLLIRARQQKTRILCCRELQNSIADSSHQLLADLIKDFNLSDFRVTNNSIINILNGSDFIFKGLHRNEQSIKSTEGVDIAWVEEAQTVSEKSIEILTPTVRKAGSQIIYTYNRLEEEDPVHKRLVIEGRPNTLIINVNYDVALKYDLMPDEIKLEMEDDKEKRPDLYQHKWLGEPLALLESRIYQGWEILDEIPRTARLERYGLDFGYSNDPSALVAVYYYDGGYILDEVFYLKGLKNKQIADRILGEPEMAMVVADSAEPKSIDEIKDFGVNITGAVKKKEKTGPKKTYVEWSIQLVQGQKLFVTKRSRNIIKEYYNYLWQLDKDGNIRVNPSIPEHDYSHSMDAIRYALVSLLSRKEVKEMVASEPLPDYYESWT